MQTADNVARWFLSRNKVKELCGESDLISNRKLQILLYYAQGMHLALCDAPLFADEIVAWRTPVVEAVYDKYKSNGDDAIKIFSPPEETFTDEETITLQFTTDAFGQFTTWKLAEMARDETPWQTTAPNAVIALDKMKDYFEKNYVE